MVVKWEYKEFEEFKEDKKRSQEPESGSQEERDWQANGRAKISTRRWWLCSLTKFAPDLSRCGTAHRVNIQGPHHLYRPSNGWFPIRQNRNAFRQKPPHVRRLKSGAETRNLDGTSPARQDFRPTFARKHTCHQRHNL